MGSASNFIVVVVIASSSRLLSRHIITRSVTSQYVTKQCHCTDIRSDVRIRQRTGHASINGSCFRHQCRVSLTCEACTVTWIFPLQGVIYLYYALKFRFTNETMTTESRCHVVYSPELSSTFLTSFPS